MQAEYDGWRIDAEESRLAYDAWAQARGGERRTAFSAYRAALEREERAGARYAELAAAAQEESSQRGPR